LPIDLIDASLLGAKDCEAAPDLSQPNSKEFNMPQKPISSKKAPAKPIAKPIEKAVSTPVRNTPIPKVAAPAIPAPKQISREMVAKRAFEIFASGTGGSESDNWFRAERELRGL
jgi:hypothetical protein